MMKTSQKNVIRRSAKTRGMRVVGNFLIAAHTNDIVSGLAIDAGRNFSYLWTFILPTYDRLSFLHMGLGERVVAWEPKSDEVMDDVLGRALDAYRQEFEYVETASDLLGYFDNKKWVDQYPLYPYWVRYISYIRLGEFSRAEDAMEILARSPMSTDTREKMEVIKSALLGGGWLAAQRLLDEWSIANGPLLGNPKTAPGTVG